MGTPAGKSLEPMRMTSGIGPQVMAKWGDSEICEEIERLLPN